MHSVLIRLRDQNTNSCQLQMHYIIQYIKIIYVFQLFFLNNMTNSCTARAYIYKMVLVFEIANSATIKYNSKDRINPC